MVIILTTETGRELATPITRWRSALSLARRYGWEPKGTVRPTAWDGSYLRPCGQMIPSEDARRFAAALTGALDDVPDHAARPSDRAPNSFEEFSGPAKDGLATLAEFLAAGACTIFGACDEHRGDDLARA